MTGRPAPEAPGADEVLSAGTAASSRAAAAGEAYELPTVDPGRALVPDHRAISELLDDEDVERALRRRW